MTTAYEFRLRHERSGIVLDEDSNVWRFGDGAAISDNADFPELVEPPTDPVELLKARRRFLLLKIEKDLEEFEKRKVECVEQNKWSLGGNSPPPSPGDIDDLKRLATSVKKMRADLSQVEQALSETPEGIAKRQHAELRAQQVQQAHDRLREIMAISID